jgi:hypothetical protein
MHASYGTEASCFRLTTFPSRSYVTYLKYTRDKVRSGMWYNPTPGTVELVLIFQESGRVVSLRQEEDHSLCALS